MTYYKYSLIVPWVSRITWVSMIRFLVSQFLINLLRYYQLISHSPGDPPQYFRNQFSKFNSLDNQILWKTIYFIESFYVEMYIMSFGSRSTSALARVNWGTFPAVLENPLHILTSGFQN